MSQQSYAFYLKTSTGHRGAELLDVISFEVTMRWNQVSKWSMSGAGLTPCPMSKNSEVIIYRGSEAWFSGYVTDIEDKYTALTGIYDWRVEGSDDLGKLERRVIYPDPADAEVQAGEAAEYTAEGRNGDLLLELIRRNISALADLPERRIATLSTHEPEGVGEEMTISAKYDTLLKFILNQLKDGELGLRSVWNGKTGVSELQIYLPDDVSDTVVFSVEAGSLASWSRKRSAPKGNVILVTGCEITEEVTDERGNKQTVGTGEYQKVIVQDEQSIADWGRYELYIQHGNIKPIEDKDEETGEVIYTEPWESVYERLCLAALSDLETNSASDGYELETIDLEQMQYRRHWDLGDIVTVRIGSDQFTAPIKEIKVEYSGGIETVTPTVGELQKGELQSVFDTLGALKNQVNVLENGKWLNDSKFASVVKTMQDLQQQIDDLEPETEPEQENE